MWYILLEQFATSSGNDGILVPGGIRRLPNPDTETRVLCDPKVSDPLVALQLKLNKLIGWVRLGYVRFSFVIYICIY